MGNSSQGYEQAGPVSGVPGVSYGQLVDFLDLAIKSSATASSAFRCDLSDRRHRYAVLLLYALTDHARAVLSLARAEIFPAIAVVTRSAIDAYVDLCNLCDHPHYFKNLNAADATKLKKLWEAASPGRIAALKALSESELLPVGRRKNSQNLRELTAQSVKTLDIADRFDLAKLTDEYLSLYAILSAEVHNNISGLEARYVDREGDEGVLVRPGQFARDDPTYGRPCTLTMGEMVVKSTEKVLRLFGHGVAVISSAGRELDRIAALAQAEDEGVSKKLATERATDDI